MGRRLPGLVCVFLVACGPKVDRVDDRPWQEERTCEHEEVVDDVRTEVRIERDARGRVVRMETVRGDLFRGLRRTFGRDGAVVEVRVDSSGEEVRRRTLRHRLDAAGRVVRTVDGADTTTYAYDDAGNLTEIHEQPSDRLTRYFRPDSRHVEIEEGIAARGLTHLSTLSLDDHGRPLSESVGAHDTQRALQISYERDRRGFVHQISEHDATHLLRRARCEVDDEGRRLGCAWDLENDGSIEAREETRYGARYGDHACVDDFVPRPKPVLR